MIEHFLRTKVLGLVGAAASFPGALILIALVLMATLWAAAAWYSRQSPDRQKAIYQLLALLLNRRPEARLPGPPGPGGQDGDPP